jgi:transcription-repair coupling factor (superfamily II helicase)
MTTDPNSASSTPVPPLPRGAQSRAWWRAPASPSALAWFLARAALAHDGPIVAIARDNHQAHQLEGDLRTLLGEQGRPDLPVLPFPDWETLSYDRFSPHPDIVSQRLAALHRLPALKRGIVVVPVQTLMQRLPPLRHVVGGSFDYRVGQVLDFDAEKRRLETASYRHVPQVLDPGDFAVRWAPTRRCASSCWTTPSIRSASSIRKASVRWKGPMRCSCCPAARYRWTMPRWRVR